MEFSPAHVERHQQIIDLQEQFSLRYTKLQLKYETLTQEVVQYKQQAHYWEAQFGQLKSREELLKAKLEELRSQLRKREQQLFGKKSEKSTSKQDQFNDSKRQNKKNRGQQTGSTGHGKRDYSHLPAVEETVGLLEQDAFCPCCGLPYEELFESEDSEILEVINVKAYRRLVRRKKYKRQCCCERNEDPQIIVPPPMERLIPKSKIGISIWALLLLNKYDYQQPIYRTLKQLSGYGLSLAKGTVMEGLQKLLPLFVPV